MNHYNITKNVADAIYTALSCQEDFTNILNRLEKNPRVALTDLIQPDEATRSLLDSVPNQPLLFIARIIARTMDNTQLLITKTKDIPYSSFSTSIALNLGTQVANWLGHDQAESENSLTGTFNDFIESFYLCFIALMDLDEKESDMLNALARLAACEIADIVLKTGCDNERMNFESAENSYFVALNNLPNAC